MQTVIAKELSVCMLILNKKNSKSFLNSTPACFLDLSKPLFRVAMFCMFCAPTVHSIEIFLWCIAHRKPLCYRGMAISKLTSSARTGAFTALNDSFVYSTQQARWFLLQTFDTHSC